MEQANAWSDYMKALVRGDACNHVRAYYFFKFYGRAILS